MGEEETREVRAGGGLGKEVRVARRGRGAGGRRGGGEEGAGGEDGTTGGGAGRQWG